MSLYSVSSLVLAQWALMVGATASVGLLTGVLSAAVPAIAMLTGAALWTALRGHRRGWMSREQVRWLAPRAGVAHGAVGAAAYATLIALFPSSFSDIEPVAAVLSGAIFGGLAGLVLTLCGINAVNMEWGAFNGKE